MQIGIEIWPILDLCKLYCFGSNNIENLKIKNKNKNLDFLEVDHINLSSPNNFLTKEVINESFDFDIFLPHR